MSIIVEICRAGERSSWWLERQNPSSEQSEALQQLGLLLCERIRNNAPAPSGTGKDVLILPSFDRLVRMERDDLLELSRQITSRCPTVREQSAGASRGEWGQMFGGVALAGARIGDLIVVAALVRAGHQLGLSDPWLLEATQYLLAQQRRDGSFGLFVAELAKADMAGEQPDLLLKATVETLWALSESRADLSAKLQTV